MLVELYKAQYWGPTSGMGTPDKRSPREPLADKAENVELNGVKQQLAERAAENRSKWNKS